MLWFNFITKLIRVLHSGEEPRHLAAGFALGAIIGLTPFLSLHNLLIFCLIFLLNVSIPAATFGIFCFECFAYLFDPLFHDLGYFLLARADFLKPVWTYLYNIPIAPLTRFNNTVVLGSLITGLALIFPNYLWFKKVVELYREHFAQRVDQFKIMRFIKGSGWYQTYQKIKLEG